MRLAGFSNLRRSETKDQTCRTQAGPGVAATCRTGYDPRHPDKRSRRRPRHPVFADQPGLREADQSFCRRYSSARPIDSAHQRCKRQRENHHASTRKPNPDDRMERRHAWEWQGGWLGNAAYSDCRGLHWVRANQVEKIRCLSTESIGPTIPPIYEEAMR